MNRNDSGTNARELARVSTAAETQSALDPKDYWTRASSTDKFQFTGDNNGDKKVVAATQTRADAPGTYTVKDKDSLWSIASKMVNDSNTKDKSDKFKLDVVKGLVEKNKGSIKGLEANPDKISAGQVLKVADVEELAKLGHGKVLNTQYKPPEQREKGEKAPRPDSEAPRGQKHRPQQSKFDGHDGGQYGDQRFSQRPMDLGPVKDILGMFGAIAGGAMMADRFNDRRHHHWGHHHQHGPRGYYEDYGQNYYDRYRQPHHHRHHHQFQSPIEYSHYGRPSHNYVQPFNDMQSMQYRMQPNNAHAYQQRLIQQQLQQQQRQQWHQYHRHT
ncbi:MAG: LysM peptidoglycan-binding domain-containing protein [Candidatus Melainabacteria bacterium]|jgi:LysM repeat protein|nr:LysM peptidoglycan-binding domain-containing protein [Candidatus Melainabacteria bacterium]